MGSQRTTFGKLQRDRDKKAKAAAKRERRLERNATPAEPESSETETIVLEDGTEPSAEQLLELIAQIHRDFEAHLIDQEEFEEKKAGLMSRLRID